MMASFSQEERAMQTKYGLVRGTGGRRDVAHANKQSGDVLLKKDNGLLETREGGSILEHSLSMPLSLRAREARHFSASEPEHARVAELAAA